MNQTRLFKILYYIIDKGNSTAPELAKSLMFPYEPFIVILMH